MDNNEYSAREIMGWVVAPHLPDRYRIVDDMMPPYPYIPISTWHPDEDRNQLAMVIERVQGSHGRVVQRAGQLLRTSRKVSPGRRFMQRLALYKCAMTDPAKALDAIVTAHREAVR